MYLSIHMRFINLYKSMFFLFFMLIVYPKHTFFELAFFAHLIFLEVSLWKYVKDLFFFIDCIVLYRIDVLFFNYSSMVKHLGCFYCYPPLLLQ